MILTNNIHDNDNIDNDNDNNDVNDTNDSHDNINDNNDILIIIIIIILNNTNNATNTTFTTTTDADQRGNFRYLSWFMIYEHFKTKKAKKLLSGVIFFIFKVVPCSA